MFRRLVLPHLAIAGGLAVLGRGIWRAGAKIWDDAAREPPRWQWLMRCSRLVFLSSVTIGCIASVAVIANRPFWMRERCLTMAHAGRALDTSFTSLALSVLACILVAFD